MTAELQFDEARHQYTYRGKVLPSVTTVCKTVPGYPVYPNGDAAEFGRLVHAAAELFDRDSESATFPSHDVFRHIVQWQQFMLDYDAVWFAIEERVMHPAFGYAGTLDRRGRIVLNGQPTAAIVDIKTGQPERWHGVQLAGYDQCFVGQAETYKRVGVYLTADSYRVRVYDSPSDYLAFNAARTLTIWGMQK